MATFGQKLRLLQGLLGGEVARLGPFCVTVDVTQRCNLRCLGCRRHSPYVSPVTHGEPSVLDLPLDLYARLCEDLSLQRVTFMVLTGEGEPLLHPGVFEIVTLAKRAGCHVTLFTNGTLLTPANAGALVDCGLDVLRVSLWGVSPEEYQRNYPGTPLEMFSKVVAGLRHLSAERTARGHRHPRVHLHEPINRHNVDGIEALINLAAATGCDGVSFSPLKTRKGRLDSFRLSEKAERELWRVLLRMRPRMHRLGLSHNIDETRTRYDVGENVWAKVPCYMPWLHARIKVDGSVQACLPCDQPLGNLRDRTFAEIWNGPAYRSLRKDMARGGVAFAARSCDCGYCCHLQDNLRVHRFYKWFAPLAALLRRGFGMVRG
jgi:MoaA/NifB/PqqE/SkfB family radical SAM enzyme